MAVPPRLELALLPTPILKLERLSRRLGVELYLKRDDLTGLLESGGEIRKLEFLAADALAQGADTLITYGSLEAGGCRAVAAVAARLGCRAVLGIKGERPAIYDGNLLLDRLLGAEVRFLAAREGSRAEDVLEGLADEVRGGGGRPYVIPEGGANEVGALGYLECAVELAEQITHGAPRFDTVVIAASGGASQAGLLMGKQLTGLPSEIVGVPVASPGDLMRARIAGIIERGIRRFGFAIEVPKAIHLLEGDQGPSGEEPADEELQVIVDLAHDEGILFDPLVTVKAFRSLLDVLERDSNALGPRVCFIHTGGFFGLFPLRDRLSRLIDIAATPRV